MSRSIWLNIQQGKAWIHLEEPAELFVGVPSLNRQAESSICEGSRSGQRAEMSSDGQVTNVDVRTIDVEGQAIYVDQKSINSDSQVDKVIELRKISQASLLNRDNLVVHWQAEASERYCLHQYAINAGVYSHKQLTLEQMKQRWQALRLNTDAELKDERLFLVQCIDLCLLCWCRVDDQLQPLGETHIVQRDMQGLIVQQEKQELSERTLQALETAASRALYALWMDVGSVLVAVSGTGKIAIRNVWSLDTGARELPLQREVLNQALKEWLDNWKDDDKQQMYIGADPELIVLDEQNKLVMASELLLDYSHEEIGIDSLLYKGQILFPIVELRPLPEAHPAYLVNRIHRLLKQLHSLIDGRKLQLRAGAMPVKGIALGGHLHISGVSLTPRLLRLLDIMLALPFAALADERGRQRNSKFGGLGDYRKQFHGGFEYRTLPSWLVSPALTQAAIYTCWLVVQERARLMEKLDSWNHLEYDVLRYELATREEQCTLAQTYIDLLVDISEDSGLAERLRPLQRALSKRGCWDEQQDIRVRWQLSSSSMTSTPLEK